MLEQKLPIPPHWKVYMTEQSIGVYRIWALNDVGGKVEYIGYYPDELRRRMTKALNDLK